MRKQLRCEIVRGDNAVLMISLSGCVRVFCLPDPIQAGFYNPGSVSIE